MAHGFLSYQDTRGEVDYLSKIGQLLKRRQKETGKKGEKGSGDVELKDTPQGVEPIKTESAAGEQRSSSGSGPTGLLKGSALSSIVGKDSKGALPPGKAIQPEVLGGALSRISRKQQIDSGSNVYDTTATRVDDPIGSLSGIGELIVKSNNNVIEAIMGVQRVTVRVIDSVENLGRMQAAIAEKQMQQQMLLATRAEVAAERNLLAAGADKSSNITADPVGEIPKKGGGFLQLPGLGGIPRLPGGRRGGALARRAGTRAGTRAATRTGTRLGAKGATKIGAKALGKGLLKKIPLIGLGAGLLFAAERAMAGDLTGAALEAASGAASTIPGFGTAASVGIDAALAGRDMGLTPFASGGIITQPTASLMGESGNEGVFPLEGTRGKRTFLNFGRGVLDAQKEGKKDYGIVLAEGFKRYFSNMNGWGDLIDALVDMFKKTPIGKWLGLDRDDDDPKSRAKVGDDLFSTISGGEGGIDSYNTGSAGGTEGYTPPKPISKMTVGDIMDDQANKKLFAVGKYQIVPDTLKEFVRATGISRDDIFNEETQDKFKDYVVNTKRPDVGKFLRGAEGSSLEKAQLELAAEFASVGVPYAMKKGQYNGRYPVQDIRKGESLYKGVGNNRASISPETIAAALRKEMGLNEKPKPEPEPDLEPTDDPPSIEPTEPTEDKASEESEPVDWTRSMPDYGLPADPRRSLSLGKGIYARRIKDSKGDKWKIYSTGLFGTDFDTTDKNESLRPRLQEAGRKYQLEQSNASVSGLEPAGDNSTELVRKSSETQLAQATVVQNITYLTGGGEKSSTGNGPGSVPFAIGSESTGTTWASQAHLRTIGA